jgi:hypothetical protein
MKNIIASIVFLAISLYVIWFWIVGSNGHIRFRPNMLEDWIYTGAILISFGLFIYFLLKQLRGTKKSAPL